LCETKVGKGCYDGRHQLSDTEGTQESVGRTLHEEETVRTCDENQRLRYNGNLEVDDHVQLVIIVQDGFARLIRERNPEFVLEEGCVDDGGHQSNAEKVQVNYDVIRRSVEITYVDAVK
jgi:hypothetical protein